MHKKTIYFLIGLILISFIFTSCAKKEEAKEEVKKVKKVTEVKEGAVPAAAPVPSNKPITEEKVLFSFEEDLAGWEIPDWALDKDDHVAESVEISEDVASEGKSSLKVMCNFPGGRWTAAVVELEQYLDLSPYREIAADVYIPKNTPLGLRAKLILTVGEKWRFTEMTRTIPLVPGEWVTVRASIDLGSYDWKRTVVDEAFRQDVRKIVVRIESNRRPIYKGPVYIDNVRIGK